MSIAELFVACETADIEAFRLISGNARFAAELDLAISQTETAGDHLVSGDVPFNYSGDLPATLDSTRPRST